MDPDDQEARIITSHRHGRLPKIFTIATVALAATAAAAFASTLDGDGTRLVWTADAGKANTLALSDPVEGTLRITSTGDPITDALPAGCSDAGGDAVDCTGYGEADFHGGDGDDILDASAHGAIHRIPLLLEGGDGDDWLTGGAGGDRLRGGDGFDRFDYATTGPADSISITQNGAADDGRAGEADDVASDIERIDVSGEGDAVVTTTGVVNQITTAAGDDTVDPAAGNDFVQTGAGNDTVHTRDGYADFVTCGDGTDTATVDQFDNVRADCETVHVATVPNAHAVPDDAPPKVQWTAPAADRVEMPHQVSTLRVESTDDRKVSQVVFRAGSRVLCTDSTAPYECAYSPTDEDVGKATLVAIAIDEAQQTATDLRFVEVERFTPGSVKAFVGPKSDRVRPHRFRAHGRIILPRNVSIAEGCNGRVTVRYKVGRKTISSRRARVRDNCKWSRRVEFNQPRRLTRRRLTVKSRFNGNDVLKPRSGKTRKVRVR